MHHRYLPALFAGSLILCAQPAQAEPFSIDFGSQSGVPGPDFMGASTPDAPQGGTWLIPTTNGNVIDFDRVFDTSFTRTDVYMRSSRALDAVENPNIFGDEDLVALVADGILLGESNEGAGNTGPVTITLENIDNGFYEVITYTAPFLDLKASMSVTINGQTQIGGGSFPSTFFQEGITHTRHRLEITDNLLTMRYDTFTGVGVINGFQVIPVVPAPATLATLGLLVFRRRNRA